MIDKEKIAKWYPKLWNLEMVKNAVKKGVITEKDYQEITGQSCEVLQ